jgi:hypothetical protein
MSKQRIDEMKKFMQIAEGDLAEAKVNPQLKKAAKLMQQVVDGLGREWEEIMNGADGDEEELEFAEHVDEDKQDYEKIVKMLLNGRGKQAAKFYDGLDTVSREFIYDHIDNDGITFLQKVFDKLGSDWLFMDEYFEESADKCEKCGREGCECGPDCDCEPVDDTPELFPGTYDMLDKLSIGEDLDEEGMGHYNVTVAVDENYPDDIEIDLPYPEAVQAAGELAKQFQKGRWEMKKYKMQDAVEWQIKWDSKDDTHLTTIRVEPSDEAEWAGSPFESIELESIAESVLSEDGWEEPGHDEPAATGKSDAVKKAADELGLDVVDLPLSDPDDDDDELGLRFD